MEWFNSMLAHSLAYCPRWMIRPFANPYVAGKNIDDALKINNADIAKSLKLPPIKMHCSMLAEDAIKAAIADVKQKRDGSD